MAIAHLDHGWQLVGRPRTKQPADTGTEHFISSCLVSLEKHVHCLQALVRRWLQETSVSPAPLYFAARPLSPSIQQRWSLGPAGTEGLSLCGRTASKAQLS